MALTDTALRAVKPGDKAQKLFDGKGLFMLVSPNGTKHGGSNTSFTAGKNSFPLACTPPSA